MMIKLCAFADEADSSLDGQIAALKRNNIPYLELRSIAGKNVKDFSLEEAKEYAKTLAENGISVWSIGSPIGKVGIDVDIDVYMKDVRHVCELAKIFGTTRIRMFSFFHAYESVKRLWHICRKWQTLRRNMTWSCIMKMKRIFTAISWKECRIL